VSSADARDRNYGCDPTLVEPREHVEHPEHSGADVKSWRAAAARSRAVSAAVVAGGVRMADAAVLALAGFAAYLAEEMHWGGSLAARAYVLATVAAGLGSLLWLERIPGYRLERLRSARGHAAHVTAALAAGMVGFISCLFVLKASDVYSRFWAGLWMALAFGGLMCVRMVVARAVRSWERNGRIVRRLAVVGAGGCSEAFIARVCGDPDAYAQVVGVFEDHAEQSPPTHAGIPVLGNVDDLVARSRTERIDAVVVTLPGAVDEGLSRIIDRLQTAVVDVYLTTDLACRHFAGRRIDSLAGVPLIQVGERPLKDWDAVGKAIFDRLFGALLLTAFSPVIALAALAVKIDSPGPAFFRQKRLGFNNQVIEIYKLRTMRNEMCDPLADRLTQRDDPRITRVGRWLRRMSVDELPQLFNVVRGEMSLVGPRPHPLNAKAANTPYAEAVSGYARRHRVKPGITGWAQVNGWRGETETIEQIEQRVAHDIYYIENWSLWFDVKILFLTVREIRSRHAY
jgi:polysaccharide biosynthesis protein PslA